MATSRATLRRTIVATVQLATSLWLVPGALAQTRPGDPMPTVREVTLHNGLTVLLCEDHAAPVVTWTVDYRMGARDEGPADAGAARELEQMAFGATDRFARGQIEALLERNGARVQTVSGEDFTGYSETYSADRLDLGLQLEADRMRHVQFDQKARQAALAEIRDQLATRQADPALALDDAVQEAAFVSHPYHYPPAGFRGDLDRMSLRALRRLYDTYYRPDNAVAALVGDFDMASALALIHQDFDPLEPGPVPVVNSTEPAQTGERRIVIHQPGPTDAVELAFHIPAATSDATPVLAVISQLLAGGAGIRGTHDGDGTTGRLQQGLVATGLASRVWAAADRTRDPGLFRLGAELRPGVNPQSAEAAMENALASLSNDSVSAPELDRARALTETREVFDNAGTAGIASFLDRWSMLSTWQDGYRVLDGIPQVTARDIQQVSARTFSKNNRTAGWFVTSGPAVRAPRTAASSPDALAADPDASASSALLPEQPCELHLSLPQAPRGVQTLTLPGGLTVVVLPDPLDRTVAVSGFVRAGSLLDKVDPSGLRGTAELVARVLAADARRTLTRTLPGASLTFGASAERTAFSGQALTPDAPALLGTLARELARPTFSAHAVSDAKAAVIARIQADQDDPDTAADQLLMSALYPTGHPLSPADPKAAIADLSAITPANLGSFHQSFFGPNDTVIAVVGDIDPQQVESALSGPLASWQRSESVDASRLPGWRIAPLHESAPLVDTLMDGTRVALRLGEVVPLRRNAPGYFADDVMNAILGGSARPNRLSITLCDVMGVASSASSALDVGRLACVWTAGADVDRSDVGSGLSALRQVIGNFQTYGPTDAEVADARSRLIGQKAVALSDTAGIARELARTLYYYTPSGPDDPYAPGNAFSTFTREMEAVTPDEVVDAARRLLRPTVATVAIAGPYAGTR